MKNTIKNRQENIKTSTIQSEPREKKNLTNFCEKNILTISHNHGTVIVTRFIAYFMTKINR